MTKKRFVNKGKHIFQYGEWYCSAGGEHCAEVIAEALNILIEENNELKKEITYLKSRLTIKDKQGNEDKFKGIEEWARGGF